MKHLCNVVLSAVTLQASKQARKCALKLSNPPFFHIAMYTEQVIITITMATMSSAHDSDPTHIAEVHAISSALVEEVGL